MRWLDTLNVSQEVKKIMVLSFLFTEALPFYFNKHRFNYALYDISYPNIKIVSKFLR